MFDVIILVKLTIYIEQKYWQLTEIIKKIIQVGYNLT